MRCEVVVSMYSTQPRTGTDVLVMAWYEENSSHVTVFVPCHV